HPVASLSGTTGKTRSRTGLALCAARPPSAPPIIPQTTASPVVAITAGPALSEAGPPTSDAAPGPVTARETRARSVSTNTQPPNTAPASAPAAAFDPRPKPGDRLVATHPPASTAIAGTSR